MRLNGWQRIGVVLSVLWAIGAAIYQRNADIERANSAMQLTYKICTEARDDQRRDRLGNVTTEICNIRAAKTLDVWMDGSWGNVALMAFGPILLGWLLVYLVLRVGRWIAGGFRPQGRW